MAPAEPVRPLTADVVPAEERRAYDMHRVIEGLIDDGSFFEVKPLYAPRADRRVRAARRALDRCRREQPDAEGRRALRRLRRQGGAVLWLCDAFNVPLLFLPDVPGFMVGTAVERQGIIRHGAKMITAVTEATVPKVCVIVRKAYGAGLYAMSGPAFDPIATLALPTAKIAVMGPEPAVNAVYANKIAAISDEAERSAFVAERRAEYEEDVNLLHLASELVVDAVVDFDGLRASWCAASRGRGRERVLRREAPWRATGVRSI